jgi:hypothetical protein
VWAKQIARDVAPAWGLAAVPVVFTQAQLPAGARALFLVDTCDDPEALGYHTESSGAVESGFIGCKPELDAGAKVLTGPYAVSTIGSHEVAELFVDQHVNLYADTGRGFSVAYEISDPVQSDFYEIDGVAVSNFVTDRWFDPETPAGTKTDFMGKLHAPFTLSPGGYWVEMRDGRVSQRFGERFPDWLKEVKALPGSRASRRMGPAGGEQAFG